MKQKTRVATFGMRLKLAASSAKIEWTAVAESLGVGPRTMNNWSNDRTQPTLQQIEVLARVLGVPPAWLAFGVGDVTAGICPEKGEVN